MTENEELKWDIECVIESLEMCANYQNGMKYITNTLMEDSRRLRAIQKKLSNHKEPEVVAYIPENHSIKINGKRFKTLCGVLSQIIEAETIQFLEENKYIEAI